MLLNINRMACLLVLTGVITHAYAHEDENRDDEREYELKLYALNDSGVSGKAEIKLVNGNEIRVSIKARGLEAGRPHPQHIHGFNAPLKDSACPDLSNDINGDGIVTINEGAAVFGPIIVPLVPFDLADVNGDLRYRASFTINPDSLLPLEKRTIVLHGMTVNGQYIPSLPIACGQIRLDD